LPSSLEFPPLRTTADLQQRLGKDEALAVFHVAAGNLFGILVTTGGVHVWEVGDVRRLRTGLGGFLRELGNYNANRPLTLEDLQSDRWRDVASKTFEAIFADSRLDLAKTKSLTIVPDDVLWYLPFEALLPGGANSADVLADQLSIRYGPTAALAVGEARPMRRLQHTGILANDFAAADKEAGGEEAVQELEQAVTGPVRLPTPLPEPGHLVATLLDELIVLDEVEPGRDSGYSWSPLGHSKGGADDTLATWFALPYGGPERVVLTGFSTAAEQGLKGSRRSASRNGSLPPGGEIFQAVCGLMANGARTILLTRWRSGGRTNIDLVREFVQELPQMPATEAWQRSCLLAREAPLDAVREPRLKLGKDAESPPTADHPFFWAGYLLVDSSVNIVAEVEGDADESDAQQKGKDTTKEPADKMANGTDEDAAETDMPLPPPAKAGAAASDQPAVNEEGDTEQEDEDAAPGAGEGESRAKESAAAAATADDK
jgi:CHAT domain